MNDRPGAVAQNPALFRMVGAFDPDPGGGIAASLVERVIDALVPASRREACVTSTAGGLVCAYLTGLSPPLIEQRRPDGALVIVDGEIYHPRSLDGTGLIDLVLDPASADSLDLAGSIVAWNAVRAELTLFRDRAGIVPLYWTRIGSCLVWASSMAAIEAAGAARTPFLPALDFFLAAGFVPSPWTFVEGVHKLAPGHRLSCRNDGAPRVEPFWRPCGRPKLALDTAARSAHLTRLTAAAVERRIGDDKRIAVLLSGGIDSILLLGIAAHKLGATVETFTFDYQDYDGDLNETGPARDAAAFFGARHHQIAYRPADFAEGFAAMVRDYGEPLTYGIHSYLLGDLVAAGAPAVLVGSGPDGWSLYNTERYALSYAKLPAWLRAAAGHGLPLATALNPGLGAKLGTLDWCARTNLATTLATPIAADRLRGELWRDGVYQEAGRHLVPDHLTGLIAGMAQESSQDRLTYSSLHAYSAEAVIYWNTKWSRAYDLPIRHPYFDNSLVDTLLRLPRREKGKAEFRQVAAAFMPERFAYAPKIYQALPVEAWFRGPLKDFVTDQLAPERISRVGLFEPRAVTRLIDRHVAGQAPHHWLLLALMAIHQWLDQDGIRTERAAG